MKRARKLCAMESEITVLATNFTDTNRGTTLIHSRFTNTLQTFDDSDTLVTRQYWQL